MPRRLRRSGALLSVPVAILLASCTSGQPTSAGQTNVPASTTATSSTTSSAATTTTTPSATPTTTPPVAAAPKRSKASLEKALLAIDDLPPGYSVEPADKADKGGPAISSKDPKCRALVTIMNADSAPGALATASTSFSGGQDGPWVDEQLAAMGSAARVATFHDEVRAAVKSCAKVKLRLPEGTSTMTVRTVKAPDVGQDAVAFRISAQGGVLDGFESTQVATGVDDVELMLSFLGAYPEDIEGGTQAAQEKAKEKLGVKESSSS